MTWTDICAVEDLVAERAAAARVGAEQVAVVRLHDGSVFAVGHADPVTGVHCMARGLVGSVRREGTEVPVLFAPLFKEAYDVRNGRCVSRPDLALGSWAVRVTDGRVLIGEKRSEALGPYAPAPLARAS